MNSNRIRKTEKHITSLPRAVDPNLAISLGEMVVAFGRLEDMLKVAIKRLGSNSSLEEVVKYFRGGRGTLAKLTGYCRKHFPVLCDACDKADHLNTGRQDFIHATFGATEEGKYVRFRALVDYPDLKKDVEAIKQITEEVNSLIEGLNQLTGSLLADRNQPPHIIATISAPISFQT